MFCFICSLCCFQNCKTFAKKSIRYVPTMGWAWMFAESIFLERNWEKDKQTIGRQIKELVEHPDPIWVSFSITVLHGFALA